MTWSWPVRVLAYGKVSNWYIEQFEMQSINMVLPCY
jgi:hypothetical protein